MQQQVEGLAKRKAELQAENLKPQLGPEDLRATLLARIKADNEAVEVASQQAKQAAEAVRHLEHPPGGSALPARYCSDSAIAVLIKTQLGLAYAQRQQLS